MEYIIAIPTYQRVKILKDRTIKLLEKHKISKNKIHLFVANQKEKIEYETVLKDYKIIVGEKGLKNQRNIIQNYFPANTNILQIDDDIKDLFVLRFNNNENKYKRKEMVSIPDLDKFIKFAFQHTRDNGYFLWGVYPIDNEYFMYDKISYDLRLIVGPFFGIINRHNNTLKNTIEEKEDVERTIKYYKKDNGVVRFNAVCVRTNYYKTPGGMGTLESRIENANKSIEYLLKKYPEYVKVKAKKSGMPDVKLIKNPKI
jgi:hypothetical protein